MMSGVDCWIPSRAVLYGYLQRFLGKTTRLTDRQQAYGLGNSSQARSICHVRRRVWQLSTISRFAYTDSTASLLDLTRGFILQDEIHD